MKFELGYHGGNMESLEAIYKGYQVLITDGDGGKPEVNGPYAIGIFTKEQGEWSYETIKRIERKRFDFDTATAQAKKLVNELIEAKKKKALKRKTKK